MGLILILSLSAGLFAGVAVWCRAQGFFAPGSMGFGYLAALFTFAVFWLLPTAAVTGAWLLASK